VTYFLKSNNANLEIKNKQGKTILQKACELNNIEKVKCILDLFPKDNGVDFLFSALEMKKNSKDIAQLIANKILFIAAKQNNVPLVAKALENGADVNAKDEHEETALHKACYFKYMPMVKCLLRNKSDISLQDKNGQTPFEVTSDHAIKEQITKYAATRTDSVIKTAAANMIQKNYRFFYSEKYSLKERSSPIIKWLINQERFDDVNDLMRLFKERKVFSLRLKLHYHAAEMGVPFESSPKPLANKK